ncbi:MAG: AMP-binding protein [Burkholderiales bacterium]|nr:AMP-binding protein [Burkholderiales bacterium]
MTQTVNAASAAPATLPHWLLCQSHQQAGRIALRHKRLGVWQQRSWRQAADEVHRLATALRASGFAEGSTLAILSRPRPEALLAALAAQWLGGVAALLDPLEAAAGQIALLRALQPQAVFAEGLQEIERLQASALTSGLVLYADGRGVTSPNPAGLALADYTQLALRETDCPWPVQAHAERTAFAFYRHAASGQIEQQRITHAELLQQGRRLVLAEKLGADEEALAARAFAASGQARYLLAPWLIAGFCLNFPENLATRDNDRRELGPTLVAGTLETYTRLHELVQSRLPQPGSVQRRLVDWALTAQPGAARRVLGEWLVRRPLRDVIGFTRTRAPLLVGEPLSNNAQAFFAALGIEVRAWPDPAQWHSPAVAPAVPVPPTAPATPSLTTRQPGGWNPHGAQAA